MDSDKSKDQKNSHEELNEENIFEDLPPEIKRNLEIGLSMQRISSVPLNNPITSKISEEHIDKILNISEKEEEYKYKESKSNRYFALVYVILFLAVFVFLTLYLVEEYKDIYIDILKISVAFIGGFGSGYGYKIYLQSKK